MNTKPLASYVERLLEIRREFALYEDRVVVRARWFLYRHYEHVVQLATLREEYERFTVRYRMYRYAGWVLAGGALVFAARFYEERGGPLGTIAWIALGVAIVGALFSIITYRNRRVVFVRFRSQSGRAGLDISWAGNHPTEFESFVDQVRRQIARAARRSGT